MNVKTPFPVKLEAGLDYFWCSCGQSKQQPFCDGSHKGTQHSPRKFTARKTETAYLCGCKKTSNSPFCDGTHNHLELQTEEITFTALVQPDNREIDITEEESILLASLRNNIAHLSACGGTGKCSTCRVEILDGLENCHPRSELEEKLAKKLSFPPNIRLGCQTKLSGNVSFRRLLLDKRDADLNNQITEKKLESVGTIRNLTILFCDIKGFTPFSESLSAYDVIFILNRYFSIMREVIIRHGGEVNNYIGDAWPKDYSGATQISFAAEQAEELGIGIGDSVTVNIMGREITGEITSLRNVDFSSAGIGFVIAMNPSALKAAPHSFIMTIYVSTEAETAVFNNLSSRFSNITLIKVRNVIERVSNLLSSIATASSYGALTTLAMGFLVLLGSAASGQSARSYDAAILKTLGATRKDLIISYIIRFSLVGATAGLVAIFFAVGGAWCITSLVLELPFKIIWDTALMIIIGGLIANLVAGLYFATQALKVKPANFLRAQ